MLARGAWRALSHFSPLKLHCSSFPLETVNSFGGKDGDDCSNEEQDPPRRFCRVKDDSPSSPVATKLRRLNGSKEKQCEMLVLVHMA